MQVCSLSLHLSKLSCRPPSHYDLAGEDLWSVVITLIFQVPTIASRGSCRREFTVLPLLRQGPVTYPLAMLLQVRIFHRSLFKGNDRAQVSLVPVSPTHRFCWYAAGAAMSTSPTQDEHPSPPGRKRACSGALQLGPRKKPYVMLSLKLFGCELGILRQEFSGSLGAPWAPFWQGSPCLLQRADAHHEWPPRYV